MKKKTNQTGNQTNKYFNQLTANRPLNQHTSQLINHKSTYKPTNQPLAPPTNLPTYVRHRVVDHFLPCASQSQVHREVSLPFFHSSHLKTKVLKRKNFGKENCHHTKKRHFETGKIRIATTPVQDPFSICLPHWPSEGSLIFTSGVMGNGRNWDSVPLADWP